MTFKIPKYADLISMSQELKDKALAPVRARQAKVRFDSAIADQEEKLVNAETRVAELAAKHPLDVNALVDAVDDCVLVERRIKAIKEVYGQMFDGNTDEGAA